jgi:hypothetical protein
MLIKGMQLLEIDLKKAFGTGEKLSNDVRLKYLNTLKIFTFLIVEFANFLEKKNVGSKDNDLMSKVGLRGELYA